MRQSLLASTAALLLGLLLGCSSTGDMDRGTHTGVSLERKNYRVVKAGAIGESAGFRLLGILPIVSPTFAKAKASLYRSVGEDLTGRAIGLANQTEDRSNAYFILFSIPKITIGADVIEFIEEADDLRTSP